MKHPFFSEFVALAAQDLGYQEQPKERFLALGRRVAKQIASDLGLAAGSFDVRVNRSGIAVSGDVTLHTEKMYLDLGQTSLGPMFMYRACDGRKDFTGKSNCWARYSDLLYGYEDLLASFREIHETGASASAVTHPMFLEV